MSDPHLKSNPWRKIDDLLQAALERPAELRAAFLEQACAGEETLRREVESLLSHHEQAKTFLEDPPADAAAAVLAQDHMRLAEGQIIGHYKALSLLGVGGMGEVYLGEDMILQRRVALKLLPARFTENVDRVKRFEQEARAASALNHPNIVTIHEIGRIEKTHFIVTEFIEGRTLRQRMTGTTLALRETIDVAIQITSALVAAHAAGIVHRDIKPENIMLRPDGLIKVLDFGLAKLVEDEEPAPTPGNDDTGIKSGVHSELRLIMGTLRYMSPEQARGQKVDTRTDIFSLGVVIYEMIAGQSPFEGASATDVLAAILREEPPSLVEVMPGAPAELEWIEAKALAKEREERYQTAKDLQIDLKRLKQELELKKLEGIASARVQGGTVRGIPESSNADVAGGRDSGRIVHRRGFLLRGAAIAAVILLSLYAGMKLTPAPAMPDFSKRFTFRPGAIAAARFARDGTTVFFSGLFDGHSLQTFRTDVSGASSSRFGPPGAGIQSISKENVAVLLNCEIDHGECHQGILAAIPRNGDNVAPREIANDVWEADYGPDGTEFAIVKKGNSGFTLEYPIGTLLHSSAGWLNNVRVSPKGNMVAFVEHPKMNNDLNGSIRIVDTSRKTIAQSGNWATVKGLAWSKNSDEVWFSAGTKRMVALHALAVANSRTRLVYEQGGDFKIEDISSNGEVLANLGITYSQIAGVTGDLRNLSRFDWPTAADLSSDSKTLVFNEWGSAVEASPHVYLQELDGKSGPQDLGSGRALALSPDRKWVLSFRATSPEAPDNLVRLPTGTGGEQMFPRGKIKEYVYATWFPKSDYILVSGLEEGQDYVSSYKQDLKGGEPAAITAEGEFAFLVSQDGRKVVVLHQNDEKYYIHTDDREPTLIPLKKGEVPINWTEGDYGLYIRTPGHFATEILRLDFKSGVRTHLASVHPNPTGNIGMELEPGGIRITPDGSSFVYTYWTALYTLFLGKGLK